MNQSLSRADLHALVWARPLTVVARDFGVSRNGLAKICDRLLIPYPGRGYWTTTRHAAPPEPPILTTAPADLETTVVIAPGRSGSRRPRTRLSPEARRAALMEAAALIVARDGAHEATMKRVAREAGISEAQAHNYFPRRTDLLVALARREITAINAERATEIERGQGNRERVRLSTVTYLRQVAQRGALIQGLLNLPEVRAGLRAEREAQNLTGRRQMTERLNNRYGVEIDLAAGATIILTAVCLRAGRLLADHRIPLELAERLSLAIVTAGNRSITRAARAIMQPGV